MGDFSFKNPIGIANKKDKETVVNAICQMINEG